jgi:hypothetical protein
VTLAWLLTAHVIVVGYWLGAELVINSTYRYVCSRDEVPFAERTRLMEHVMDVDQHVRYALVLQAGLGLMLAALYGFAPGGTTTAAIAAALGIVWLGFVEAVHRLRTRSVGRRLAAIDRGVRYALMAVLALVAVGAVGGDWAMPGWLRAKLALFAGVMACGIGIRLALIGHFRVWAEMAANGPTQAGNAAVRSTYVRATAILALLWFFIAGIVFLSVRQPF